MLLENQAESRIKLVEKKFRSCLLISS